MTKSEEDHFHNNITIIMSLMHDQRISKEQTENREKTTFCLEEKTRSFGKCYVINRGEKNTSFALSHSLFPILCFSEIVNGR